MKGGEPEEEKHTYKNTKKMGKTTFITKTVLKTIRRNKTLWHAHTHTHRNTSDPLTLTTVGPIKAATN